MEERDPPAPQPGRLRDSPHERVKTVARDVGFDLVGITGPEPPQSLTHFSEWIEKGFAGEMTYLSRQREKRGDLRVAFPWARSVISVGLQYDQPHPYSVDTDGDRGWIARYAWGEDYHDVLTRLLDRLDERLQRELGPFRSRRYVDTGPIVERAYAAAAGLGAWGKNACLLNPEHGSWFFLGELVTDLELPSDAPLPDMCGSCTACLDVCPTGALVAPYELDATRCISYLTIEIKGAIPHEHRAGVGRHVFGCDLCQDVCPWNRRRRHFASSGVSTEEERWVAPPLAELAQLDVETFRNRFRGTALRRAKRRGLLRNVAVALGNSGKPEHRPILDLLASDSDPLVQEHARWALERLATN